MSTLNQKTLKQSIFLSGVGLHTGKKSNLEIKPAEPNTGIVFKRIDVKRDNIVIPSVFNVSSAAFCTTISNQNGVSVSTIEHLMGALYGMGIDNALIEIDNQEVPILDGSAKLFVEAISAVGLNISDAPIKIIKIEKKIEFNDGKKTISFEPSKISLDIDFELKYENDFIGTQKNSIKVYESDLTDIYNSRTFCLFEDVEKLKEMGLAKGGNLDNAIVVKNDEVLNKNESLLIVNINNYSHATTSTEFKCEAERDRLLAVREVNSSLEGSSEHFHLSFVHASGFSTCSDSAGNVPLGETNFKACSKVRLLGRVHLKGSEELKVSAQSTDASKFTKLLHSKSVIGHHELVAAPVVSRCIIVAESFLRLNKNKY